MIARYWFHKCLFHTSVNEHGMVSGVLPAGEMVVIVISKEEKCASVVISVAKKN